MAAASASTSSSRSRKIAIVLIHGVEEARDEDGNLYGTTENGGDFGQGLVFQMTLDGTLGVVYEFAGDSDGSQPRAGLLQADDGNLYGTTWSGGSSGFGTVFRLDIAPR